MKGINFKIQKGQTVALVGPSGGGKSTIADLLPRFYDPQDGFIEIDGKPLQKYKVESNPSKYAFSGFSRYVTFSSKK